MLDEFDSLPNKTINENNIIDCKSVMHLQCMDLSILNCERYENFIEEESTLRDVTININNYVIKCVLKEIMLVLHEFSFVIITRYAQEVSHSIAIRLDKIIATLDILDLYDIPNVKRDMQTKRWYVSVYLKSHDMFYLLKMSVGFMDENPVCDIYTLPQTTK